MRSGAGPVRRALGGIWRVVKFLGPGLITGAADDDPTTIGTFAQVGAAHGFAALWTPDPDWRIGLNYRGRSHVTIDKGSADFAVQPTGNAAVDAAAADSIPPSQHVATVLKFPDMWSLGVAWNPLPAWTWELDVNHTGWSRFDRLDLTFDQTPALDSSVLEDYADSYRVSIGAEHRLTSLTYRFGYYFDAAAAPVQSVTTLLPDANRHGATLGLSWNLGKKKAWTLDLYNLALFVENRSTEGQNSHDFDGVYKSYVNASGASLAYRW